MKTKNRTVFISHNPATSEILTEVGKHLQTSFTTPVCLVNWYHHPNFLWLGFEDSTFTFLNEYNVTLPWRRLRVSSAAAKQNWNSTPHYKSKVKPEETIKILESINCQIMLKPKKRFLFMDEENSSQDGLHYFLQTISKAISLGWQAWHQRRLQSNCSHMAWSWVCYFSQACNVASLLHFKSS